MSTWVCFHCCLQGNHFAAPELEAVLNALPKKYVVVKLITWFVLISDRTSLQLSQEKMARFITETSFGPLIAHILYGLLNGIMLIPHQSSLDSAIHPADADPNAIHLKLVSFAFLQVWKIHFIWQHSLSAVNCSSTNFCSLQVAVCLESQKYSCLALLRQTNSGSIPWISCKKLYKCRKSHEFFILLLLEWKKTVSLL